MLEHIQTPLLEHIEKILTFAQFRFTDGLPKILDVFCLTRKQVLTIQIMFAPLVYLEKKRKSKRIITLYPLICDKCAL